ARAAARTSPGEGPKTPAPGGGPPHRWPIKSGMAGEPPRRPPPLTPHPRRAIGIANHRLEEFGALDQPGLELGPFSRLDEKRHMAQRPRPFYTRWILVDAVEDAGIMQVAVGGSEAPIDFPRSH